MDFNVRPQKFRELQDTVGIGAWALAYRQRVVIKPDNPEQLETVFSAVQEALIAGEDRIRILGLAPVNRHWNQFKTWDVPDQIESKPKQRAAQWSKA